MIKKQRIVLSKIIHSSNKEIAYLIFQLKEKIDFKEGHFLMIEKEINWKKIKRAYSIANTYGESLRDWEIHFFVKRTSESGMSNFLTKKITVWDFVDISWPYGSMTNDFQIDSYFFVSIWSWCACTMPLYKKIVFEERKYKKICTLFGEKTYEYLVDLNVKLFEENAENIKNMFFLSREKSLQDKTVKQWILEIEKWHISDWLNRAINFLDTRDIKVFLCGKPEMVEQVKIILIEKYLIDKKNIKFEKY